MKRLRTSSTRLTSYRQGGFPVRCRVSRSTTLLAAALSCLVVAGCSTSGLDLPASQVVRADLRAEQLQAAQGGNTSERANSLTVARDAATRPSAKPYRVQANDLLALRFFFNPELNQDVRVQPDGAITVPLLGTRQVSGYSLPELTSLLRKTFATELRQPELSVQLLEAAERHVYVGGAVSRPQKVLYRDGMTPIEVVLAAGGFTTAARANQIVLIRKDADGRPAPSLVDLQDMVLSNGPVALLEPWDIVFVPKDNATKAGEWVDKYVKSLLLVNGISFGYDLNSNNQ